MLVQENGNGGIKPTDSVSIGNQRQHIRVMPAFNKPVRVDINGENFLDILHAKDVSETGIGIRVPHFFSGCHIDEPVQFIISLPAPCKAMIRVRGLVKHSNHDQFGVHFTHIDRNALMMLRKYIAHRIADEGDWFKALAFRLGISVTG